MQRYLFWRNVIWTLIEDLNVEYLQLVCLVSILVFWVSQCDIIYMKLSDLQKGKHKTCSREALNSLTAMSNCIHHFNVYIWVWNQTAAEGAVAIWMLLLGWNSAKGVNNISIVPTHFRCLTRNWFDNIIFVAQ